MIDKRFVLLDHSDNVVVCCARVATGEVINLEGKEVTIQCDIDVGHKIARTTISKGSKILKYGAPIGSATSNINLGEHVHLHNIQSDYISTHTRDFKTEAP